MKKNSLLEGEDNTSLLEDGNTQEIPQEELAARFCSNLGKNGMRIFEIKSMPISDKEKKVRIATLKFHTLNDIKVVSFDLTKLKGYVSINDGELEMPLANLKRQEAPYYFYDREAAETKVKSLNLVERALIDEKTEEYLLAQDFMKKVEEGQYF